MMVGQPEFLLLPFPGSSADDHQRGKLH
jgi:hypothetical protein